MSGEADDGSQWNMRNTKYAKAGKSLKSWAIVNLDGRLPMDVIRTLFRLPKMLCDSS